MMQLVPDEYCPEAQFAHPDAPAPEVEPAGQVVQEVLPENSAYVPAEHGEQTVAPKVETRVATPLVTPPERVHTPGLLKA